MNNSYIDTYGYKWTIKEPDYIEYAEFLGKIKYGVRDASIYNSWGNIIVKQGVYYCEIEKLYASVPLHKKIIDFLNDKKKEE